MSKVILCKNIWFGDCKVDVTVFEKAKNAKSTLPRNCENQYVITLRILVLGVMKELGEDEKISYLFQ